MVQHDKKKCKDPECAICHPIEYAQKFKNDQIMHDLLKQAPSKLILTNKYKKNKKLIEQEIGIQGPRKFRKFGFNPRQTSTIQGFQFPLSKKEKTLNISQILYNHQIKKCGKTGKSFDFKSTYGDDYKGVFNMSAKLSKKTMKRSNANFFENKYLESRLHKVYKKGGFKPEIPKHATKDDLPMQTFYSKTFTELQNSFRTPKYTSGMPIIKQQRLTSNAFSKVFLPYYKSLPPRDLYDRDNFETDQYSKMLYVESKMDRLIKRHQQSKDKQVLIANRVRRVNQTLINPENKQSDLKDNTLEPVNVRKERMTQYWKKRKEEKVRRQRRLSCYHGKKFKDFWDKSKQIDVLMKDTNSIKMKRQKKYDKKQMPYKKFYPSYFNNFH